ncbi:MAG: UvrD-helicase domain-containing protein [Pseudomonadales bacterium]|nr:UvrD-helicase domain-containing protein [Pseudomonadales bacterium]
MNLPDTQARQGALEPTSCLVQAPAGSGKTTLLATRFVHLLNLVTRPQEVLAITFTKKAAAEMRQRVLAMLREDSPTSRAVRQRNIELKWGIFQNPNVLKIQTIDSFALELASQSSDESTLAGMGIGEHATRHYDEAAYRVIAQLVRETTTAPLVAEFLAFLDNDARKAQGLLSTMLARRDQWLGLTTQIAANIMIAPEQLKQILERTLATLRHETEHTLSATLNQDDVATLDLFATEPEAIFSGVGRLLTKAQSLRRRFTSKDGVGDATEVRRLNLWLGSLHERGLASLIEKRARIPQRLDSSQTQQLANVSVVLTLAASELQRLFKEHREVDFVELLLSAQRALREPDGSPTDLALLLDYRIKHILIDEYQDTSRSQLDFFNLLCEGWSDESGDTFFAVGDPMQSIYRFRNADVGIFGETVRTGVQLLRPKLHQLTANFRSAPTIVNWCNTLFQTLFAENQRDITYTSAVPIKDGTAGMVRCEAFTSEQAETDFIIAEIKRLRKNTPMADIAILCRARGHIRALLDKLRTNNLDWQASDIDLLSTLPIVQDLHSCLMTLVHPSDKLAYYSLLRSPLFGLTLRELTTLNEHPESCADDIRLTRLRKAQEWAASVLYQRPIREVLEGYWLRIGGGAAYPTGTWPQADAYFDLLEPYGRGLIDLDDLAYHLANLFAPDNNTSNIKIMTIHKSKGLEFEHVFVPSLNHRTRPDDPSLISMEQSKAGLLMGVRGDSIHDWLSFENRAKSKAEEKRLLYVASTRAKDSLYLTWTNTTEKSAQGLASLLEAQGEGAATTNNPLPLEQKPAPDRTAISPPNVTKSFQADLFQTHMYKRLPTDYEWLDADSPAIEYPQTTLRDVVGSRQEVAVGVLVHQALLWWTRQQPRIDRIEHFLPARLEQWVQNLQLSTQDQVHICALARAQLEKFCVSEVGIWALREHDSHVSELALTGLIDGEIRNVIIDRMFVDGGERWILDYKSSQLDQSTTNHTEMIVRYRPQLSLYKTICSALYDEPIRTALILTDSAELVEI